MRTALATPRTRLYETYRNLSLWTLQGWLSMFFIAAGYAKLTDPIDNLVALMGWPAQMADGFVRGVGGVEIGLALGLLAPLISWRLGRPVLLMATAALSAMTLIMLGVHLMSFDIGLAVVNAILLAFGLTILWGRGCATR